MMVNLLYCFDNNYNFQAFSSIISILDKISEKINIYVIHTNQDNSEFFPNNIRKHINLNKLEVFKFKKNSIVFPNVYNSHVSEATYYRMFCTDYLPKDLESILYIDADIICVRDPLDQIKKNTFDLLEQNFTISSKTELLKNDSTMKVFNRLDLKNNQYFNAGVMNINLSKWRELSIDFFELLETQASKLYYWDQDLLNYIFDGDYLELNENLNKVVDFAFFEYMKEKIVIDDVIQESLFIHFAGSHKPWSVNGIMCNLSDIYIKEFRKVSNNNFHIVHKMRSYSIYVLFKNFVNFKFFRIEKRIYFLYEFLKSLLKIQIDKKS